MGDKWQKSIVTQFNNRFKRDGLDLIADLGAMTGTVRLSQGDRILFYERVTTKDDYTSLKLFVDECYRRAEVGEQFIPHVDFVVIRRASVETRREQTKDELEGMKLDLYPKPQNEPDSLLDIEKEEAISYRLRIIERLVLNGFSGNDLRRRMSEETGLECTWNDIKKDLSNLARQIEVVEQVETPLLRWAHRQRLLAASRVFWAANAHSEWLRATKLIAEIDGVIGDKAKRGDTKPVDEYEDWSTEELEEYASTGKIPSTRIKSNSKTVH